MKNHFDSPATRLVDPLAKIQRIRETAATVENSPKYELQMDPPAGVQVASLTVAGSYRHPIPILFDYQTRTAYPIRAK